MAKRTALIDYEKCAPEQCSPETGICPAVAVCTRGILTQEAAFEEPEIFPPSMCQGCSACLRACPLGAIRLL